MPRSLLVQSLHRPGKHKSNFKLNRYHLFYRLQLPKNFNPNYFDLFKICQLGSKLVLDLFLFFFSLEK